MLNLAEAFAKFKAGSAHTTHHPVNLNDRVLLIDGMNMYIRCFSATPTMNDDGSHVGGVSGFLRSMGAAIRQHRPSRVIVVFDGVGGSQRRREIYKDYKSNRKMMTRLNRTYDWGGSDEESLRAEQESMKAQLLLLVEILNCLPVTVITIDKVEADDVIAYLATHIEEKSGKAIILSNDKDFLQLVNENITVWNPLKKQLYTPTRVVEDYGFHPNNFLLYRVVTGDKSDNIPGVDGIKEKTLLKHFPELALSESRDIDFLIDSATHQIADKKKPPVVLLNLLSSVDTLKLNMKLMRLDAEALMSVNARMRVLDKFDSLPTTLNKYELTRLVSMSKMMSSFEKWDEWVITLFGPLNRHNANENTHE